MTRRDARRSQPYWAARVAALGNGAGHDGPTPTTESLSGAPRTTLTFETRARATAVAGTIRTDGATTSGAIAPAPRTSTRYAAIYAAALNDSNPKRVKCVLPAMFDGIRVDARDQI